MVPQRFLSPDRLNTKPTRDLLVGQPRIAALTQLLKEPLILKLDMSKRRIPQPLRLPIMRLHHLQHQIDIAQRQAAVVSVPDAEIAIDGRADKVIGQKVLDALRRIGADDAVGLEQQRVMRGRQRLPEPGPREEARDAGAVAKGLGAGDEHELDAARGEVGGEGRGAVEVGGGGGGGVEGYVPGGPEDGGEV